MNFQDRKLEQLGEKEVLDENGESIVVSSLWKEERVVLIFIRHFG